MIATFLLTGGREKEVTGLEISDVNFKRKTVTFRPNEWRELKTAKSHRTVELWPQLEGILTAYLDSPGAPKGKLLFPAIVKDREQVLTDERKMIAAIQAIAGIKRYVTPHLFRHTYTAARLQTLDGGAPVSPYTVSRELGHGG